MAVDEDAQVIGVARLQFNSDDEAQIRYMAVEKAYQRHGVGRELIKAMETYADESGRRNIVLDAREPTVSFYQKLGYTVVEKSYLLFDEIQHYQMMKTL